MAEGKAAGWRSRMEKGSPTGEPSRLPPSCFEPGCRCLTEPSRPPSAEGRDCRTAECNQSREETNNLFFFFFFFFLLIPPPEGLKEQRCSSLRTCRVSPRSRLGGWPLGEGHISTKSLPSRGQLFM